MKFFVCIKKVRPFLPREKNHEQKSCVAIHPQTNQIVLGDRRTFKYDFVFGPKTQQVKSNRIDMHSIEFLGRIISNMY